VSERKPMEPVGYGHRTAHGWVVSKGPLTPDSEPLLPVSAIREAVERASDETERLRAGFLVETPTGIYGVAAYFKRALLAELGLDRAGA